MFYRKLAVALDYHLVVFGAPFVSIAETLDWVLVEERFLRRELAGYEAYTNRIRYRLIPYLW
jgi:protein-S-isoprenylcysteine O-methyltransferase Ste14